MSLFSWLYGSVISRIRPLPISVSDDDNEVPEPSGKQINVDFVKAIFPAATPRKNIEIHLPLIMAALRKFNLEDEDMTLMALATIRAETAGFEPISEFQSQYNTSPGGTPFNLYNNRSSLGNGPDDGARFKGRGFIQLTGRSNYTQISKELGLGDGLVKHPDSANEPHIAAAILARYLKNKEAQIRAALEKNDLKTARKLVNGGSHGLEQFSQTFTKGKAILSQG